MEGRYQGIMHTSGGPQLCSMAFQASPLTFPSSSPSCQTTSHPISTVSALLCSDLGQPTAFRQLWHDARSPPDLQGLFITSHHLSGSQEAPSVCFLCRREEMDTAALQCHRWICHLLVTPQSRIEIRSFSSLLSIGLSLSSTVL